MIVWSVVVLVVTSFSFAALPKAAGQTGTSENAAGQLQSPYHRVAAGVKALACEYQDEKLGCEMYVLGVTDAANMVLVAGDSTRMLCGRLDAPDLIAEFTGEAVKNPQTDTVALLLQLLKANHLCAKGPKQVYTPRSAGQLVDLCHAGDDGYELCSQYQRGFLDSLFFMSEQTKTPLLCGDMRVVDNSMMMLDSEVQADSRLRQQPAVSLIFEALQKQLPCPK